MYRATFSAPIKVSFAHAPSMTLVTYCNEQASREYAGRVAAEHGCNVVDFRAITLDEQIREHYAS